MSMFPTAYDLKEYYATTQGQGMLDLLLRRFAAWWPDAEIKGDIMIGAGYALPYLDACGAKIEKYVLLPGQMGAVSWPPLSVSGGDVQRCVLADRGVWPLPNASVDYILMIHELEYAEDADSVLEAAWQALKPEGRLLLAVPNRTGLWARAEKTPFGHGRPFTQDQLRDLLKGQNFSLERSCGALLAPPLRSVTYTRKIAPLFEYLAPVCTALSGVIIAEASKRLYSPIRGKPKRISKPAMVWADPAPAAPARKSHHV